jgi:hypothetical protein
MMEWSKHDEWCPGCGAGAGYAAAKAEEGAGCVECGVTWDSPTLDCCGGEHCRHGLWKGLACEACRLDVPQPDPRPPLDDDGFYTVYETPRVEVVRPGDWIQTYTGKRFYVLDPRLEDICIEDIAHSLALQCRYLGHAKWHYSVAQHCVLLTGHEYRRYGNADAAFDVLMHDAGEAYYGDWPRPIKNSIPQVERVMRRIDQVIYEKFDLGEEPEWIRVMDLNIVCDEKKALMKEVNGWTCIGREPLGVKIEEWTPEHAEKYFLEWFHFLSRERAQCGER